MATWIFTALALVAVCFGQFPALGGETGQDLPEDVNDFINNVDAKIDDSVDAIEQFFKGAKRSVDKHRVRRSWFGDNAGWIVPLAIPFLLGRDESSAAAPAVETAKRTDATVTQESLDKVNDAIDFLKTISETASNAIKSQENQ